MSASHGYFSFHNPEPIAHKESQESRQEKYTSGLEQEMISFKKTRV